MNITVIDFPNRYNVKLYKILRQLIIILFLIFISYNHTHSQVKNHAFSGKLVLTLEGGATLSRLDYRNDKFGFKGIISAEYFLPTTVFSAFGFRIYGGTLSIFADDVRRDPIYLRTEIEALGFSITYSYSIKDTFFPFFSAGLSKLWFDPYNDQTNRMAPNNRLKIYSNTTTSYDIEFGARIALYERLSIKVGGAFHFLPTDFLDDYKGGVSNDFFGDVSFGISYSFFGGKDSDNDGVDDDEDQCSNTPPDVEVDDFGCPIDYDNDGIPDYLDDCPNTIPDVIVDEKGCVMDSDNDGIADSFDKCPNTPLNVIVDNFGCPIDSDDDGVPDYLDHCPGTESGIEVDEYGCPLTANISRDDDSDGIFNDSDNCADTPLGLVVDQTGCPVVFYPQELTKETNRITIQTDVVFYDRSDVIKSEAEKDLNNLVSFFEEDPFTKWRVEGHTDSIDTEEFNQAISKKRAQTIVDFFVSKRIPSFKFIVKGFGSSVPILEKETEDGRRRNKRIEIIRIE